MTTPLLILLGLIIAVAAWHGADIVGGWLVRRVLERRLARSCRQALLITYDDGPGEHLQRDLLTLLAQHDAPATFFLLGNKAQTMRHAVRDIQRAGHQIGNHGFGHVNAWKSPPWTVIRDIARGERAIGIGGHGEPLPWRPPLGRLTLSAAVFCFLTSRPICMWTIDGCDSLERDPSSGDIGRMCTQLATSAGPGGCVLLHSFDRTHNAAGADRHEYVLNATKAMLAVARDLDLHVCRMDKRPARVLDGSSGQDAQFAGSPIQSAA